MNKDQFYSQMTPISAYFMMFTGVYCKVVASSNNKLEIVEQAQEDGYKAVKEMLSFNEIGENKHSVLKIYFMFEAMAVHLHHSLHGKDIDNEIFEDDSFKRMLFFAKHLVENVFAGYISKEDFNEYKNVSSKPDLDQDEALTMINDHLRAILAISGRAS
jgi:hypothetical protein